MVDELALLVVDRIERLEAQRLAWGLVDGGFSDSEIYQIIDEVIGAFEEEHDELWVSSGEVLDALERQVLLWRTPEYPSRYRSRSAEAVRLFARLRQMFKSDQWQSGAALVSDFRYQVVPRRFPRREIAPQSVAQRLNEAVGLSPDQEQLLAWILKVTDQSSLLLSEFQVQAAESILTGLSANQMGATAIAAGTGAGKTLAFLLPTLLYLVGERGSTQYAKSIAVYPRNELLKDQLRAVLERLLPLHGHLTELRGTPISVGALFGSVPEDAHAVSRRDWGWTPGGVGEDKGFICPFLQCPRCDGDLVWREADIEAGSQGLKCTHPTCGLHLPSGILRLTREALRTDPPDVLFTSTEMMNRSMSDPRMRRLFGVATYGAPRALLLDEIHTYSGTHGAQVAILLRRWRKLARARPHIIGLSATLADASRFMSELTGIFENNVRVVEPAPDDMETQGAEYTLALRGDPVSESSLLSTTIQSTMLMGRVLDSVSTRTSGGVFGTKVFAFGDNLDVVNRLHDDLSDAEGFGGRSGRRGFGSLANLRNPSLEPSLPRWEAGQNWDLCVDIGHSLSEGARRQVSRVSSQDSGVDRGAQTIVATASLEVGFDDPEVGAVIQHKAPRDAAAYIQRRGRAGRNTIMRPWTAVVLSDYGRDRLAYQRYEDLFSPVVPARFLPIHNPFVLKIQASFAVLDWIGARVPVPGDESVFKLLARPVRAASWYRRVTSVLLQVLTDQDAEEELRSYLTDVLEIDEAQAVEIMWAAPRSLMLEVLPTILRRVETGWQSEMPTERFPLPLPEFLPSALFADLNLPELAISLPDDAGEERMPFRQGLAEFAPGRVSRRFGVERQGLAHWVPVPYQEDTGVVDLQGVLGLSRPWELGEYEYPSFEGTESIRVVRPRTIAVARAPRSVSDNSNAFLIWRTQITLSTAGREMRLPPTATRRFRLSSVAGFLHSRGAPVEMRRFTTAVDAETKPERGGRSVPPRRYGFVLDGQPVALGYSQPVDALRFQLQLPAKIGSATSNNQHLLRHLRVLRFRALMHQDDRIKGLANKFQIDWICDAVLSTLGREALTSDRSVNEVAGDQAVMSPAGWVATLQTIFDVAEKEARGATAEDGEQPEAGTGGGNRRFRDLAGLLDQPAVQAVISDALPALHETVGEGWEPWLKHLAHETMGAALLTTTQSLIHEMAFDDLLVDVLPRENPGGNSATVQEFDIWISENTPGGAGLIERVESLMQEDPQRFLALLEGALEASDAEQARVDLGQVAAWLAPGSDSHRPDVASAAVVLRDAASHVEEIDALEGLKGALGAAGLFLHPATLAAVNLRLLRPGSSADTDDLYHALFSDWDLAEERVGFEFNPRVFAEIKSHEDALDQLLIFLSDGEGPSDPRHWRFSVLNGLLWPGRGTLRLEGLRYFNPFSETPICDRLIISSLIRDDVPLVDVADDDWRERLAEAVGQFGAADLTAPTLHSGAIRNALLDLSVNPLDVGALAVHPRVRGFSQRDRVEAVRVEVPELFGGSLDG